MISVKQPSAFRPIDRALVGSVDLEAHGGPQPDGGSGEPHGQDGPARQIEGQRSVSPCGEVGVLRQEPCEQGPSSRLR